MIYLPFSGGEFVTKVWIYSPYCPLDRKALNTAVKGVSFGNAFGFIARFRELGGVVEMFLTLGINFICSVSVGFMFSSGCLYSSHLKVRSPKQALQVPSNESV